MSNKFHNFNISKVKVSESDKTKIRGEQSDFMSIINRRVFTTEASTRSSSVWAFVCKTGLFNNEVKLSIEAIKECYANRT